MATSDEATHPPSHHVNNDTMKQKQLIIIILQKCLDSNEFLQTFLCCYCCFNVVELLLSLSGVY